MIEFLAAAPVEHEPLTKRELFAAMAMQGLLTSNQIMPSESEIGLTIAELVTARAIVYSDALIAKLGQE